MSLLKTLGSVNKLSYRAFDQKKKKQKKKKCCLDFEFVALIKLWGKLTQLNLNILFGIIIVLVFFFFF